MKYLLTPLSAIMTFGMLAVAIPETTYSQFVWPCTGSAVGVSAEGIAPYFKATVSDNLPGTINVRVMVKPSSSTPDLADILQVRIKTDYHLNDPHAELVVTGDLVGTSKTYGREINAHNCPRGDDLRGDRGCSTQIMVNAVATTATSGTMWTWRVPFHMYETLNYDVPGKHFDQISLLRAPIRNFVFKVRYPGLSAKRVTSVTARWQNGQYPGNAPAMESNVTGSASILMSCPE